MLEPTVAFPAISRFAINLVDERNTHEFTVTPVPNAQVAPVWKFDPVIATFTFWVCAADVGLIAVTDGGTGGTTENVLLRIALWLSGFVTVIVLGACDALELTVMFAVIWVD